MSRSVHTRPRRILSATRLRAPREPRSRSDTRTAHALGRAIKELGLERSPTSGICSPDIGESVPLPRLRVQDPRRGYIHPATQADILAILEFFGAEVTYGVRSVELVRGVNPVQGLLLGRLLVPGRIVLYDQLPSPWLLPGRLPSQELERLEGAGAQVERAQYGLTRVTWPENTLKEFMLLDVLLHELGHHILQHHKGKRRIRIARTRDHEAYARTFAEGCRRRYWEAIPSGR